MESGMSKNRMHMERIYLSIESIIGANLNWYDAKNHTIIRYNSCILPETIKKVEEDKLIAVGQKLESGNARSVCYFENAYKLRYIAVAKFNGVIYEGAVILGPYLSYEHTRHLVQGVLENKELSVEQREKLQTFFSILPIVDFNKEEAFAHILN